MEMYLEEEKRKFLRKVPFQLYSTTKDKKDSPGGAAFCSDFPSQERKKAMFSIKAW